MDLLFILIGIGLAAFVILVSYKSISRGIKAKLEAKDILLAYQPVGPNIQKLGNLIKNFPESSFAESESKLKNRKITKTTFSCSSMMERKSS